MENEEKIMPLPEKQEIIKEQLEQLEPKQSRFKSLEKLWFVPLILAILAILIIGGLWISNQGFLKPEPSPTPLPSPIASPEAEEDAATAALEEQSTSDEIEEIEADLEATDLDDIDEELTDIENELSAP